MRDALSPAVFIDRDGTIMEDTDYCSNPKDVRIFPGVLEALRRLKSRGFKLIVITNQSGIGRGLFTLDQYHAVESEVRGNLAMVWLLPLTTVRMLPDNIRSAASPRREWLSKPRETIRSIFPVRF